MPEEHTILCKGEEIRAQLDKICEQLMSALPGLRTGGELTMAVILDGAVPAAADLRHALLALCPSLQIHEQTLRISRTRDTTLVKPQLQPSEINPSLIEGHPVVIIDDLVDEGATLQLAHEVISGFRPAEVFSVVIVQKRSDEATLFKPDYSCIRLNQDSDYADTHWLFGYGMDLAGKLRELDYIAECEAGDTGQ